MTINCWTQQRDDANPLTHWTTRYLVQAAVQSHRQVCVWSRCLQFSSLTILFRLVFSKKKTKKKHISKFSEMQWFSAQKCLKELSPEKFVCLLLLVLFCFQLTCWTMLNQWIVNMVSLSCLIWRNSTKDRKVWYSQCHREKQLLPQNVSIDDWSSDYI